MTANCVNFRRPRLTGAGISSLLLTPADRGAAKLGKGEVVVVVGESASAFEECVDLRVASGVTGTQPFALVASDSIRILAHD
jgi:hypothetical protein